MNEVDRIVELRKADPTGLREGAIVMSKPCNEATTIEMNTITILESNKGLAQTCLVQFVTYLAYVFLPMTLYDVMMTGCCIQFT
jgi:hypothetical protein